MRAAENLGRFTLFGAPAECAAGLVVVPRQHARPAVAGEDGGQQDGGGGLVRPALAVDDGDGARSGPVLADGLLIGSLAALFLAGPYPDPDPGEHAADACGGRRIALCCGVEGRMM